MNACKSTVSLLACLFLSTGCDQENMQGAELGPDGAVGSVPDADLPSAPDANDPIDVDAAVEEPSDLPIELACTLDEVQPILQCALDNCLDSFADGTTLTCMTFSCGLLLLGLSPDCSQCLLTGLADPSSALDVCVSGLEDLGGGFPIPPAP